MDALRKLIKWVANKCGRIVTIAGVVLTGAEAFDVNAIKGPLEELFPVYGHKIVIGLTMVLFIASWARHQYVASQHPTPAST